ncbi:MAG TPA: TonB-dependent receptor [Thermoguttaceae bacterium]|nr:TonB-dependent receptor [Thermoguttaceae bacterium]
MNEEVSTVSRTESTVGRSPSAVYVITNDMIRHSGARNLPEALRLVPGVQVAQVTKTTWAISIRGFNARYANSLLVQIDGRAVYTPGFGGVYWDQQQVLLDDVERIEVIRGPGATVWGANAVNGVINIVTKPCDETQGLLVQSGGGDEHRSFNALRGGGRQGDLRWRLSGIQADDAPGYTTLPGGPWDSLQLGQGSFRMDWTPSRRDTLTLQGDFLGEKETFRLFEFLGPEQREPEDVRATNFLGRWTRKLDDETDWTVQMYYDNWQRLAVGGVYQLQNQNTFDLDSQYHAKMGDRHDVVCGFGYRNYEMTLDVQGPSEYTFVPPYNAFDIISYFAQDTIELRPDRLYATLGIKFEHNDFTNFEYQPSAKLLWSPDERTAFWGSISRAVRTPSVAERDIVLYGGLIRGTRSLRSEDLLAYELGMRRQPSDRLYWDLAVFYNRYDNLIGTYPVFPPPSSTANIGYGGTYGYELLVTYEMNPNWRLRGAYSFLVEDISYGASGGPFYVNPDSNPRNQSFLHSTWNLSQTVTFDMILRYVDRLATGVPRYLVMDVRLGWEPRKNLELAVVGQNLLDDHHPEFNDFFGVTEVPAGVYGMVSWRY